MGREFRSVRVRRTNVRVPTITFTVQDAASQINKGAHGRMGMHGGASL
jgi:hypothetical protein